MGAESEIDIGQWRKKLAELEVALSRYPHVTDCLNPPASERMLRDNCGFGPFVLPDWLQELYRWHDGCEYPGSYLFELPFNSLKQARTYWAGMAEIAGGFGWYRSWTFPFLGVDKDMTLAILDEPGGTTDPSILSFMMQDQPCLSHRTPFDWVDSLLFKLSHIDEDAFDDDGHFTGYWRALRGKNIVDPRPRPTYSPDYGSLSAGRWPDSYRERGGIADHLVPEDELPPWEERTLHGGEKIPHAGPWNVYFGDLAEKFYKYKPPKLPTDIRLGASFMAFGSRRNPNSQWINAVLPEGVLSDRILRHCLDLDAVVWFETKSIASQQPVIARIAFPV